MEYAFNFKAKLMPFRTAFKIAAGICLLASSIAVAIAQEVLLYRYKNIEGVTVISSTLPPEYAQKGYDVISPNGRLIKRVAPALDPIERAKREKLQAEVEELLTQYRDLSRRYKSVEEIYAVRDRQVALHESSIAIAGANIQTIKSQIETLQGMAANEERLGREPNKNLQDQIANATASLKKEEEKLEDYIVKKEKVISDHNGLADLFQKGAEILEKRKNNEQ